MPSAAVQRFWTMLAHYHGQVWNAAESARTLAVSEPTTRRHLELLTDAFMIRQLQRVQDAPRVTPSIRIAQQDLGLKQVLVLYPGAKRHTIADGVEVVPVSELAARDSDFEGLGARQEHATRHGVR